MPGRPAIRPIGPHEVDRYREVRLAALTDAPSAFTATLAEALALPAATWVDQVCSSVDGESVIVVADPGAPGLVGLAVGIPWGERARVVSVWVDPAWRGGGIARRMIEAVCAWAARSGYDHAQIETAVANPGPQRLYEDLGFRPVDEQPPAGCGVILVRPLP
jgi:ribosomal protein S18 acetylase RimI-like enzyme